MPEECAVKFSTGCYFGDEKTGKQRADHFGGDVDDRRAKNLKGKGKRNQKTKGEKKQLFVLQNKNYSCNCYQNNYCEEKLPV